MITATTMMLRINENPYGGRGGSDRGQHRTNPAGSLPEKSPGGKPRYALF